MTTLTPNELRDQAAAARREATESFERCDTDGFLSQWASGLTASKLDLEADIREAGGRAGFVGLYEGDRRVAARKIETRFGMCWLLRDDEQKRFGRKFVPIDGSFHSERYLKHSGLRRSRVQVRLGLRERHELAAARAEITGTGQGLAGAHTCRAVAVRTGDRWGLDADLDLAREAAEHARDDGFVDAQIARAAFMEHPARAWFYCLHQAERNDLIEGFGRVSDPEFYAAVVAAFEEQA
jgi:hypothetical protein